MSAQGWTPGPWVAEPYGHTLFAVRAPSAHIATAGNLGATSDHKPAAARWKMETAANARLIAAAPDLAEALREAREFIQPFNRAADLYDRIEAALIKAGVEA